MQGSLFLLVFMDNSRIYINLHINSIELVALNMIFQMKAFKLSLSGDALDCPADLVTVNENKTRIVAFLVLLTVTAYLYSGYLFLPGLLLGDFVIRTTPYNEYSLLNLFSDGIIAIFNIKNKPVDRVPKRFAAGTGLAFTIFILVAAFVQLTTISFVLSGILVVFAGLESFTGFCAGCYIYSLLKK